MLKKSIILGSSSPRRQELLKQVHIPYQIRTTQVDETIISTQNPEEKVKKLAQLKNKHISINHENELILTADTIVSFKESIFEKPKNKDDAFTMISQLSGNIHDVYTGVMIRSSKHSKLFVERTKVEFWPLTEEEIMLYVNTGEPYDKAGGYGIQSLGAMFVKQIIGDYYNVVGLPISRVVRELKEFNM